MGAELYGNAKRDLRRSDEQLCRMLRKAGLWACAGGILLCASSAHAQTPPSQLADHGDAFLTYIAGRDSGVTVNGSGFDCADGTVELSLFYRELPSLQDQVVLETYQQRIAADGSLSATLDLASIQRPPLGRAYVSVSGDCVPHGADVLAQIDWAEADDSLGVGVTGLSFNVELLLTEMVMGDRSVIRVMDDYVRLDAMVAGAVCGSIDLSAESQTGASFLMLKVGGSESPEVCSKEPGTIKLVSPVTGHRVLETFAVAPGVVWPVADLTFDPGLGDQPPASIGRTIGSDSLAGFNSSGADGTNISDERASAAEAGDDTSAERNVGPVLALGLAAVACIVSVMWARRSREP